jgi:hypothetical protein
MRDCPDNCRGSPDSSARGSTAPLDIAPPREHTSGTLAVSVQSLARSDWFSFGYTPMQYFCPYSVLVLHSIDKS